MTTPVLFVLTPTPTYFSVIQSELLWFRDSVWLYRHCCL